MSIPVLCKDDILDVLKSSINIDERSVRNDICYNILVKMIQKSIDLNADIILDTALGSRKSAKYFFDRLDFKGNKTIKFYLDCDIDIWKRRHEERLKNPLPHQSFKSIEHVMEYYEKMDVNPFED